MRYRHLEGSHLFNHALEDWARCGAQRTRVEKGFARGYIELVATLSQKARSFSSGHVAISAARTEGLAAKVCPITDRRPRRGGARSVLRKFRRSSIAVLLPSLPGSQCVRF